MKSLQALALVSLWTAVCAFACEKHIPSHGGNEPKQLVMQPGPDEGQDCLVAYREFDNNYYGNSNHSSNPDFTAIRWTYDADGAGEGTNRSYLKFTELSKIPANAKIAFAKLSLFGVSSGVAAPLGNSFYPGSPYAEFGSNECWLKRVLSDWSESTITWNNKPATTDIGQVTVAASNAQWNYNVVDLDVTEMVKEMVRRKQNYGFCLQLKQEEIYRSILFGSSEAAENKRPRLIVQFK